MRYTRIPEDAFQKLQLNAGILLSDFTPGTGAVEDTAILGATTGGVKFTATPTYSDFGEDIDNAPVNVKELKKLDSREVIMSGTFVTVDTNLAKQLIGAADIDTSDATKVTPRSDLADEDFKDIWLVADYSDKTGDTKGGYVAVHMLNALSTGGFQIQTSNRAKGQFAFEFTGHYSLEDQSIVPFELYIKKGEAETAEAAAKQEEEETA